MDLPGSVINLSGNYLPWGWSWAGQESALGLERVPAVADGVEPKQGSGKGVKRHAGFRRRGRILGGATVFVPLRHGT